MLIIKINLIFCENKIKEVALGILLINNTYASQTIRTLRTCGSLQLLVFISFNLLNNSRQQVLFCSFCVRDGAKTINVETLLDFYSLTTKDNLLCCW